MLRMNGRPAHDANRRQKQTQAPYKEGEKTETGSMQRSFMAPELGVRRSENAEKKTSNGL